MINPDTIEEFLIRRLANFDWLKDCTAAEIDQALLELNPKPDFGKIKPWLHQKACFLILNELQRFMYFIDMGGGKTLLTLMMLKYLKQRGEKIKAIVFVPFITSVSTWIDETTKHTPELKCVPLLGSTTYNLATLDTEGDLFVICYQSAVAMISEVEIRKSKSRWNLKADLVRTYFRNFNFLVMDEIHRCKSASSLTYRMCRAISAECDWALGLTGTPFGKDLNDLWPQFNLIDFGETLGPTLNFYQHVFFRKTKGFFGGYDLKFKKRLLPDLKRIIKNRSVRYEIDELVDMPPRQYILKFLNPPDTGAGYCEDALRKLREAQKQSNYQEIESNYLKLRQLSSGFLTLKGEDNERLQLQFSENPKLECLQEIIEAITFNSKLVIFHHFVFTNNLISDFLVKLKIKHARIWGKQKNPLRELKRFKEDGDCRVLVINSRSGSSSLNLQNANYIVFFEQPDSPIDRQQAERRCWRPGQEKRVMIYDLLVRNTVDQKLHDANKAGENLLKSLLNGRNKL